MTNPKLSMRTATRQDIERIVALERSPANARFLCAWSPDRHATALDQPDKRYLIFGAESSGEDCGFAILAGLKSTGRSVELVRIAVAPPDQGLGGAALQAVSRLVFDELAASRLFLDVFDDNARARRAYLRHGFREEAVLPDAARRQDGTLGTLLIMGMDAERWREVGDARDPAGSPSPQADDPGPPASS